MQVAINTFIMLLLWLLLSGHYTALLVSFGVLSALGVALLAKRMNVLDEEGQPLGILIRLPRIALWLIYEILKSNLAVVKIILDPSRAEPIMVTVKAGQSTVAGLVTHANFITLTPGTVSVTIDETKRHISVHSLTFALADGVCDGTIDRQVCKLEGRK